MPEDLGDKTELPTTKRRQDARQEGQIARSQDLNSALDMAGALAVVAVLGTGFVGGLRAITEQTLGGDWSQSTSPAGIGELISWTGYRTAMLVAPVMAVIFLLLIVTRFLQVGWLLSVKPITPKLNKISPLSGIKRLFSRRSAVRSLVNTLKVALLAAIVGIVVARNMIRISGLAAIPMRPAIAIMGQVVIEFIAAAVLVMLLIGIVDYIYQRWQHTQDLKMTFREVKDERKNMEGDAEIKARRQRIARGIMMQRIGQAVPTADVIVTNPTHFAVALKYDSDSMEAPRVVAKGGDLLAMRIREIASAHRIPIVERPALARALYAQVDVGRAISPEFYEVVAEILAYVYRLDGRAA